MGKVKLTADSLGETKELTLEHAQALLDYQSKQSYNDWKLDDNRYTLEDGRIKPVGNTQESEKQKSDSAGNKSSKTA